MMIFGPFFRRAARRNPLRVERPDAFSASLEKYGITAREGEIIRLLLEGKDSRQITEALFISDHTVKNHIHHIYQKLGIRNRVQLVQCFRAALGEPPGSPAVASPAQGAPAAPEKADTGLRRAVWPTVLLLVVFGAVLVAWRPWSRRGRPAALPPPPALAILDFENLSDDADLGKWVTGLPLLLTTDLMQSKSIRTLSDDVVFGALKKHNLAGRGRFSREELRRLAKELKADYLLTGSLIKAGGRIVATAFLQDARTGAPVRTEKIESEDEQGLMRGANELARLVKSGLAQKSARAPADTDLDVEVLTTSSALAYKYYVEGRRYHRTGDYEQSLHMLTKAVELDPAFAMAYRAMSSDARNLGYYQRELEYMRKAFDLAERLPESCRERRLIRADYFSRSETTLNLAVEEFKKVLEDHPYDLVANNNVGILSYGLEDFESAVRYADVPIRQGTSDPFPFYTKAVSLRALGRPAEALRLLAAYHEGNPANRLIYQTLAATLVEGHDYAGAGAAVDKAMAVFPDPSWSYWKGVVDLYTRGADAAREEFRQLFLMEESPWRLRAHFRLACLALAEGRFEEAEKECRAGAELAESVGESEWASDFRNVLAQALLQNKKIEAALVEGKKAVEWARAAQNGSRLRGSLHVYAVACLRAGDPASVEGLTREFRALVEAAQSRGAFRDLDFFLGVLELEFGRPGEAVKALESAATRLPEGPMSGSYKPMIYYYLAQAREWTGDFAGAAAAFEKATDPPGFRLDAGEYYPLAVLGRARMKERLGLAGQALEGYRVFLEMWKNADPERPEVAEARSRAEALSGADARRD